MKFVIKIKFRPQPLYLLHEWNREKEKGLLHESSKDKDNAGNHPGLHCCQALSLAKIYIVKVYCVGNLTNLGWICLNGVEDVDEDEEDGDEQRHSPRNHLSLGTLWLGL